MASNPPATPSGPTLSSGSAKVIGFLVGGAALVILAEVAPQAAIGMTVLIGLGVVLTRSNEVKALANEFITATGGKPVP